MSKTSLYKFFKPATYLLEANGDILHLTLTGQKIGPPSHRITLHQAGLKIIKAKVTRFDKRGPVEIEVIRISHLPSFQEVRLHGETVMYPGRYRIEMDYKIKAGPPISLDKVKPNRELLPSIDEAEAWQVAELTIKQ